jgi:probable lipoprotein NlpC
MKNFRDIASDLVGIPYRCGGRNIDGLDCLGLTWLFYQLNGISIPDTDGGPYDINWAGESPDRFLQGLLKIGDGATGDLQPLDLVYFRFGGKVTHSGVMVDRTHFIHVMQESTVRITPLTLWRRRFAGARRLV